MKKCLLFLLAVMVMSLMAGCGGSDKFAGRWVSEPYKNMLGESQTDVLEFKANGDKGYVIKEYTYAYDNKTDSVELSHEDEFFANKPKEGNTVMLQGGLPVPIVYDENTKTIKTDLGGKYFRTVAFNQVKDDGDIEQMKEKILEADRPKNKK